MNTRIEDMENKDSDFTNSDDDGKEKSHFQFEETYWFQVVHQTTGEIPNKSFIFNKTFGGFIKYVLFKQNHTK